MKPIITKKNAPRVIIGGGGNESGIPGQPAQPAFVEQLPDGAFDRLLKLIPTEVIVGYTALLSITASAIHDSVKFAVPFAMLAVTILIPLALRRAGRMASPAVAPPLLQYVFSILAFWVWAVSIRDPLVGFGYEIPTWIPAFGFVLVPLFGAYLIDLTDKEPHGST